MSPCDATLWLFRDGYLALTQYMQQGPFYSTGKWAEPIGGAILLLGL